MSQCDLTDETLECIYIEDTAYSGFLMCASRVFDALARITQERYQESCGCPNVILTDEMPDPAARCHFSFLLALLVIFVMLSSNLTDSDYQPNQGHSHLTRH